MAVDFASEGYASPFASDYRNPMVEQWCKHQVGVGRGVAAHDRLNVAKQPVCPTGVLEDRDLDRFMKNH
jgi:hypothetical protein